jgi:hypothetical protein
MEISLEVNAEKSTIKIDVNDLGYVDVRRMEVVQVRVQKTVCDVGNTEPSGSDTKVLVSYT